MKTKQNTIQLVLHFLRAYPGRSVLMVLSLLVAGLMEGISIVMFLPLIEVAAKDVAVQPTAFSEAVRQVLLTCGVKPELGVLLGVIVLGMTLKAIFLWIAMRQVGYTIAAVATDMRLGLIGALLEAKWGYFTSQPTGHFANAVGAESRLAANAYRCMALCVACFVQLVIYTAIAVLVAWQTALLAVVGGTLIMFALGHLIRISREAGRRQTSYLKALAGRLVDSLNGIKPIKAMAREPYLLPLLEAETQGLHEAQRMKVVASQTLGSFQEPLMALILAGGLYVAVTYFSVPAPALLMQVFLFTRLIYQANSMVRYYQTMTSGEAAFWSLQERIEQAREEHEDTGGTVVPGPLREKIRLDRIAFSYDEHDVLRDVTLEMPAGKLIAIVGTSGTGKTTLSDLLIGLVQPQRGEIIVDGVRLRDLDLRAWRRLVGYVPQEMFLFHDTIFNNISAGDPGVSREDAESALRAAGAWDFVSRLPGGLDAPAGERGSKMSGGQRQRIALARALARKPTLLILDEVTAGLDPETETAICKTLGGLRGDMTIVAISHQPAITGVADIVYRIEGGKIAKSV